MCAAKCECICVIEGNEQDVKERIGWINKRCCTVIGIRLEADCVFNSHSIKRLTRKIVKTTTIRGIEGHVRRENWKTICDMLTVVASKTNRNISIALYAVDFAFTTQIASDCVTHMRDSAHSSMVVKWSKIPIE